MVQQNYFQAPLRVTLTENTYVDCNAERIHTNIKDSSEKGRADFLVKSRDRQKREIKFSTISIILSTVTRFRYLSRSRYIHILYMSRSNPTGSKNLAHVAFHAL